MMIACKGSIYWKFRGLDVIISYDRSDLHGIPFILVNGRVIGSANAFILSRKISILDYIFTDTEVRQIKYLLHPVSIYTPEVDEDIRFSEQSLTEKAKFLLGRTSLILEK